MLKYKVYCMGYCLKKCPGRIHEGILPGAVDLWQGMFAYIYSIRHHSGVLVGILGKHCISSTPADTPKMICPVDER